MTNYERIRNMGVDEMAVLLREIVDQSTKIAYEKFRNDGIVFDVIEFAPEIEIAKQESEVETR